MSEFELLSVLLSTLALIFQAISTLHPFTKNKRTTSTQKQVTEGNREQEA
jgi:hypothetical protein